VIEIEMSLFGAFRKFHSSKTPIALKLDSPATIDQVKIALSNRLKEMNADFGSNGEQLVKDSALASESDVLLPNAIIAESCKLAILPPVCGG
jgi:molybdopterin converting factor small subunit